MDRLIDDLRDTVLDEGFVAHYCSRDDMRARIKEYEAPMRKRMAAALRALRRIVAEEGADTSAGMTAELALDYDAGKKELDTLPRCATVRA